MGKAFLSSHLCRTVQDQQGKHSSRDLLTGRTATFSREEPSRRRDFLLPGKTAFHLDISQCEIKSWHIWEMVHGEVINSVRGSGGNSLISIVKESRTQMVAEGFLRSNPYNFASGAAAQGNPKYSPGGCLGEDHSPRVLFLPELLAISWLSGQCRHTENHGKKQHGRGSRKCSCVLSVQPKGQSYYYSTMLVQSVTSNLYF